MLLLKALLFFVLSISVTAIPVRSPKTPESAALVPNKPLDVEDRRDGVWSMTPAHASPPFYIKVEKGDFKHIHPKPDKEEVGKLFKNTVWSRVTETIEVSIVVNRIFKT